MRIPASPSSRITNAINAGDISDKLSMGHYNKHVVGTNDYEIYKQSRVAKDWGEQVRISLSAEETQEVIRLFSGRGIVDVSAVGKPRNVESIDTGVVVGSYCK